MSESQSSAGGGIGFLGLLTIVFITLKLTGVIDWEWWVVLLPLIAPLTVAVILIILFIILAAAK